MPSSLFNFILPLFLLYHPIIETADDSDFADEVAETQAKEQVFRHIGGELRADYDAHGNLTPPFLTGTVHPGSGEFWSVDIKVPE